MTYNEAIDYIHKINWTFCNPGLERIEKLCNALGNPQKSLKFIHVAGTNGKGSFCSMLSSILKSAGYRVGLFTSPYVRVFNERMAINGEMISNDELAELTSRIKPFADSMDEKPTEFELITAIAFDYFAKNNCDYVILECGLGGRLDSTNIIDTPVLTVITGIALDHTSILGNTIKEIAGEKAGIIKSKIPCLWCGTSDEASEVISKKANECSAPLYTVDHSKTAIKKFDLDGTILDFGDYKDVYIPLLGEYQPFNASNVLCAVGILTKCGISIPKSAIYDGLASVKWHARFEILSKKPLVIADGGHNPEGVCSAVSSVEKYFNGQKIKIITGVMADKDYEYIADKISSVACAVYCVTPDNPRALDAQKYAKLFASRGVASYAFSSVEGALSSAYNSSKSDDVPILCTGSLYMYSEVCDALLALDKES